MRRERFSDGELLGYGAARWDSLPRQRVVSKRRVHPLAWRVSCGRRLCASESLRPLPVAMCDRGLVHDRRPVWPRPALHRRPVHDDQPVQQQRGLPIWNRLLQRHVLPRPDVLQRLGLCTRRTMRRLGLPASDVFGERGLSGKLDVSCESVHPPGLLHHSGRLPAQRIAVHQLGLPEPRWLSDGRRLSSKPELSLGRLLLSASTRLQLRCRLFGQRVLLSGVLSAALSFRGVPS